MSDTAPTMAEVLRRGFDSRLSDVYLPLPGRIETYYPETQTADVKPVVRRAVPTVDDDVTFEDLPVVPNVPILFPRGGGFSITWKLVAGDHVQLLFQMLSISQWRRTGEISDPGDLRLHNIANAVAVPGLAPNSSPLDSAQASANALILDGPEIRLGKDATDYIALASLVHDELTKIKNALSSAVAPAGGGPVTYGSAYSAVGNVAATQAKAK